MDWGGVATMTVMGAMPVAGAFTNMGTAFFSDDSQRASSISMIGGLANWLSPFFLFNPNIGAAGIAATVALCGVSGLAAFYSATHQDG